MKTHTSHSPPTSQISRRDFLTLASALSLVSLTSHLPGRSYLRQLQTPTPPNVIIILFDALSAFHLSLYGYSRKTSPNIDQFGERATVFHAHHSAGNFTTPSTASLFTGTYPWTHRAFGLSSLIRHQTLPYNLFDPLKDVYFQFGFSQNIYADMLLYQFNRALDSHARLDSFALTNDLFYNRLFHRDAIIGMKSIDQFLFKREEAHGSLFLSIFNDLILQLSNRYYSEKYSELQPNGLPRLANTDVYFILEQVMDGVMQTLDKLPQPFFAYLHFMPPHAPYLPTQQFLGQFNDGWSPTPKKKHRLAPGISQQRLNELRKTYDEFILNLDAEFGRLFAHLERTGLLETSYLIFTSDHGELFERGVHGHSSPLLFEPGIRIPLIVSSPGQRARKDIYDLTSNIDLLPTLLNLTQQPVPKWCEGRVLPGLGGEAVPNRSIYVIEAKKNPSHQTLRKATIALIKDNYKLIHYMGYKGYENNDELYDLKNDPEEIENIFTSHPLAKELRSELDQKLLESDKP